MAKPSIQSITTSQTFQNWFDKTNELVTLFRNETLTASSGGDTTTGNATLIGNFTASNITANTSLFTDTIAAKTSGGTIDFSSPVEITGASSPIVATFNYGASGGKTRYTDGSISWDIGLENSDGSFVINTGSGNNKFELSPAGTLTVNNLIVLDSVFSGNTTLSTAEVSEDPSATPSSGTQYFTRARAQAAFKVGTNITFSAPDANGVIAINTTESSVELAGSIKLWAGSTAPTGWSLCQGQELSRSTYATLFGRIGTTYGAGNGATTFNLPDLRGRMPIGASTSYALGSTGGSKDAALITHSHLAVSTVTDPGHTHSFQDTVFRENVTSGSLLGSGDSDNDNVDITQSKTTGSNTTGITVNTTVAPVIGGVSATDKNLPPYLALNWIIKLDDSITASSSSVSSSISSTSIDYALLIEKVQALSDKIEDLENKLNDDDDLK